MKRLPTRPDSKTQYRLTDAERYALCCYCVFECSKLDVFMFAHPEVVGTKALVRNQCEQFFASSDVANFLREYREMLDNSDEQKATTPDNKEDDDVDLSERMQRIKRKIFLRGEQLAKDLNASKEELDLAIKLLDKSGVFDTDEEVIEQPRRYLPETCSNCRYKIWIEENCDIENE